MASAAEEFRAPLSDWILAVSRMLRWFGRIAAQDQPTGFEVVCRPSLTGQTQLPRPREKSGKHGGDEWPAHERPRLSRDQTGAYETRASGDMTVSTMDQL